MLLLLCDANLWVASALLTRRWEWPWCPRRQNRSRFVLRSQWELVKRGDLLPSTAKVRSTLSPVPKTLSLLPAPHPHPAPGTWLKSCIFWRRIMVRIMNNGYNNWGREIRLCIFSSLFWVNVCKHLQGRRQWQPTPVLLPGKSHGQRSLVGCSPWGR